MKKILVIAAVLCCMFSATAQKVDNAILLKDRVKQVNRINHTSETYTEKLDSITTVNSKAKVIVKFFYDDRYNVMRMEGEDWVREFVYDSLNRVASWLTTYYEWGGEEYVFRNEYVYNEQGWVVQELVFSFEAGTWVDASQVVYELDENGCVLVATEMDSNGENYAKREYLYQGGLLVEEIEYNWNYGWSADNRIQYAYDDRNDCIERIMSYYLNTLQPEWLFDKRYTYEYDNNHNCIKSEEYYYDYDYGWIVDSFEEMLYYYDLSMTSSSIAGLSFYGEYNNKLLYYTEPILIAGSQYEEHFRITQLHYSTITNVGESHEDKLDIWPNPVKDVLNLGTNDLQEVEIIGMDGRIILTIRNVLESVNVSSLSAGCYLMKATRNDGIIVMQKFVKQ